MFHLIHHYISNHSNDNYDCSSKNRSDDSNKSVSDPMVKIIDPFTDSLQNRVYVYDS
jgi:hypothetical protein